MVWKRWFSCHPSDLHLCHVVQEVFALRSCLASGHCCSPDPSSARAQQGYSFKQCWATQFLSFQQTWLGFRKNSSSCLFSPPSADSLKLSQGCLADQAPHKIQEQSLQSFNSGRDVWFLNMYSEHGCKKKETQLWHCGLAKAIFTGRCCTTRL